MADSLILEVADFEVDVLTGIYSEETGKPQPLRITIQCGCSPADRFYEPDTPLIGEQELHGPEVRGDPRRCRRASISS
jgi:hypothetical protein